MTRPGSRPQAAMSAAFAGAVDLSALAARSSAPAGAAPETNEFVVEVDEANFGAVVQSSTEVLVVFEMYSPRSAGAEALTRALIRLAGKGAGAWLLARVDVDANPRIATALNVQAVPTVIAVAQGQPVDGFSGVQDEPRLAGWLDALLDALQDRLPGIAAARAAAGVDGGAPAEPEDPRMTAVDDLLDQGDYDGARAALRAVLAAEPAHAMAAAALVQVDFLARLAGHSPDAVEQADAHPEDVAAQTAAADVELAGGHIDAAFTRLVAAVRRTTGDERAAARDHLLSLFALYPADDPRVRSARRALAGALY